MAAMYDPRYTRAFYDAYSVAEWSRLEATAYGRLQAIIHTDFMAKHSQALSAGLREAQGAVLLNGLARLRDARVFQK